MSKRVTFKNDKPGLPKPPPTVIYTQHPRTFRVTIEHIDPKKILHKRSIARQVRTPPISFGDSKENFIRAETVALKRLISIRERLIIQREGLLQCNGQDLTYKVDSLTDKIQNLTFEVYDKREILQALGSFS